jgi:hypothetical protein
MERLARVEIKISLQNVTTNTTQAQALYLFGVPRLERLGVTTILIPAFCFSPLRHHSSCRKQETRGQPSPEANWLSRRSSPHHRHEDADDSTAGRGPAGFVSAIHAMAHRVYYVLQLTGEL